jgi:hypothetical protein
LGAIVKLPDISKIPNLLSLKTKNGWKEIQKNSSVAAKKGQNFILDNIRPLGANKDVKARWSISASQKPVNRPTLPKKINVDFAKVVNNVWLHKTSGSMPLKGINDKLKGSLSGAKIANSFFQKTNNMSEKERHALQKKADDLLGRLKNAEGSAYKARSSLLGKGKSFNSERRMGMEYEVQTIYEDVISDIESARSRVLDILQANKYSYQLDKPLHKSGLSKNQYNNLIKELDDIGSDMQSRLQIAKNRLDDFAKL